MELHLFFDLDRTLWDFDNNSDQALRHLFFKTLTQHQFPSFQKFLYIYKGVNTELWKKYGKGNISKEELRTARFYKTFLQLGLNNKELADYFNDEYLRISPLQTQLMPHAVETLSTLQNQGYKMHIITNGFKEVQHTKLENCSIRHFFDVIVSSEEIGINKPDVQIFHHAMKLANAKAQYSAMIGDDMNVDVMGAEYAGMFGIHYDSKQKLSRKNFERRIYNLNELPDLLPKIFLSV